ncbi:MAG: hypothetical protein SOU08_00125 [Anaerococcus sp.]|nr:hypothetical protein [Anaerococcus sp.]
MIEVKCIVTDPQGTSTDISEFVGEESLSGAIKESTRTLSFKALRSDVDKNFPKFDINLGDTVTMYEVKDKKQIKFFQGVVWSKSLKDNDVGMDISCYDKAIYLNKNEPKTQVFTNKTAKDVASTIIAELGLQAGDLADTGTYNFNLRKMTGYDAIMAAYTKDSEATGKKYKLVDIDGKINVFEAGEELDMIIEELDEPVVGKILDCSYKESMDELVNEVKAIEDQKKDEEKQADIDPKSQERYGAIQKVLKGDSSKMSGLMEDAKKEIDVVCIGDWDMVSGKSIEIKSAIVSGTFYITSDEHILDDAIHKVSLKLSNELEMDSKKESNDNGESS